jgi:preprotein translocase subunit SecE
MTQTKTRNPIAWAIQYVRESREEMGKVTWPSKQETVKYSLVVIGLSLVVAAYFFGLDKLFSLGLEKLIEITR